MSSQGSKLSLSFTQWFPVDRCLSKPRFHGCRGEGLGVFLKQKVLGSKALFRPQTASRLSARRSPHVPDTGTQRAEKRETVCSELKVAGRHISETIQPDRGWGPVKSKERHLPTDGWVWDSARMCVMGSAGGASWLCCFAASASSNS